MLLLKLPGTCPMIVPYYNTILFRALRHAISPDSPEQICVPVGTKQVLFEGSTQWWVNIEGNRDTGSKKPARSGGFIRADPTSQ